MENSTRKNIGLFLAYGGYQSTIIDSQVFNHVEFMQKHGINMDIWIFAFTKNSYKISVEKLLNLKFKLNIKILKALRPSIPFSGVINSILVAFHFLRVKKHYSFIHARTDYAAFSCRYLYYFKKIRIIWDCRGDSQDEYRHQNNNSDLFNQIKNTIKIIYLKYIKLIAAKVSNSTIFVSEALYVENKYLIPLKKYKIIPSSASTKLFFFSKQIRLEIRKKLNYNDNDRVIIYNGSLSAWHCFDKIIDIFNLLLIQYSNLKLLIITPDLSQAAFYIKNRISHEKYTVVNSDFQTTNAYLCGADYAIILRELRKLNYVASPVKYAEYCMTGLPIITNSAVNQAFINSLKLGNLILYEKGKIPILNNTPIEKRIKIAKEAKILYAEEHYIKDYIDLYLEQ